MEDRPRQERMAVGAAAFDTTARAGRRRTARKPSDRSSDRGQSSPGPKPGTCADRPRLLNCRLLDRESRPVGPRFDGWRCHSSPLDHRSRARCSLRETTETRLFAFRILDPARIKGEPTLDERQSAISISSYRPKPGGRVRRRCRGCAARSVPGHSAEARWRGVPVPPEAGGRREGHRNRRSTQRVGSTR